MQQAYRIAMISLLTLMQLFAPLVHAHAGAGQLSGMVHLPGLEFLAKQDGKFAQAYSHQGGVDIIVGLSPGFKDKSHHAAPSPDPEWGIPPQLSTAKPLLAAEVIPSQANPPDYPKPFRLGPSPRAPPGILV